MKTVQVDGGECKVELLADFDVVAPEVSDTCKAISVLQTFAYNVNLRTGVR